MTCGFYVIYYRFVPTHRFASLSYLSYLCSLMVPKYLSYGVFENLLSCFHVGCKNFVSHNTRRELKSVHGEKKSTHDEKPIRLIFWLNTMNPLSKWITNWSLSWRNQKFIAKIICIVWGLFSRFPLQRVYSKVIMYIHGIKLRFSHQMMVT